MKKDLVMTFTVLFRKPKYLGALSFLIAGMVVLIQMRNDQEVKVSNGSSDISNQKMVTSMIAGTASSNLVIERSAQGSEASTDHLQMRSSQVGEETRLRAILAAVAEGDSTVEQRVHLLKDMRGYCLSEQERDSATAFLAGEIVLMGLGKASIHWLAEELLTVLRMQSPPQLDMAAELRKIASQRETDPVIRDYIMQHLGHMWQALESSDETTAESALIALSGGYERDQQKKDLLRVRERAFELAQNPNASLAVRVTALSVVGASGDRKVKDFARSLAAHGQTPSILKKVGNDC